MLMCFSLSFGFSYLMQVVWLLENEGDDYRGPGRGEGGEGGLRGSRRESTDKMDLGVTKFDRDEVMGVGEGEGRGKKGIFSIKVHRPSEVGLGSDDPFKVGSNRDALLRIDEQWES
jgi:hypothetical protein